MTKLEIIEETVAYYSEDVTRRAIQGSSCRYETFDNKHCAVGRCLAIIPSECIQRGPEDNPSSPFASRFMAQYRGEYKFKPEYEGHDGEFWDSLQMLHDKPKYWNDKGLTEDGERYVNELKKEYSLYITFDENL